jgi:hypothetical protein
MIFHWSFKPKEVADSALALLVKDALANYEPPEIGDAWTGGFAKNDLSRLWLTFALAQPVHHQST